MKKQVLILLALLASVAPAVAQTHPVRVKLRVVLVDKDLNQKPVPFVVVMPTEPVVVTPVAPVVVTPVFPSFTIPLPTWPRRP